MTTDCTASIIKLQQEEEEVRKNTDKTKYKPIGNGSPIPNVDPKNTQPGESKKKHEKHSPIRHTVVYSLSYFIAHAFFLQSFHIKY